MKTHIPAPFSGGEPVGQFVNRAIYRSSFGERVGNVEEVERETKWLAVETMRQYDTADGL